MSMPSGKIESRDWDEISQVVADAYFPHTLTPRTPVRTDCAFPRSTGEGPVRIARLGWGADVSIRSDHPGAYGVNIPVSGRLDSVVGGREVSSLPGTATVCPPDTDTRIPHWAASCEIIGVRFDHEYLEREMHRILARPDRPLPSQVDLSAPAGTTWMRFVESLSDQMEGPNCLLQNDLVADQLLSAVTTAFVLAAVPDDPEGTEGTEGAVAARPRIVKRVIDALHGDPAHRWTAGEMAEQAGVSVRRLQEGFRQYVGRSPTQYLNDIRLVRARDDLLAADPGDTVTAVALRWGFAHTGRFAATYRSRFGVSPSSALRTT
ncbi:AraC family transcriptional regulator [Rhodococcus sp. W8901]|uniref:AraC family transcriptional regulator n=1 Tax=Rhodococcus sp. W8901 TaxID=2742603 RepID=UPI001581C0EF|nr:AraC family transcriptional regulator [Rhodococcus sp. W8901]QKT09737.1 AraC family transcriptional regulator [Rhodococcus sp. W8901]